MSAFSVCVLLYGDHLPLAERCLNSLLASSPQDDLVADVRIGLNQVTDNTRSFVDRFSRLAPARIPVYLYEPCYLPHHRPFKYPMMRRMFRDEDHPLADYVMWFDDDSYLHWANPAWWQEVLQKIQQVDMLGQFWHWRVQPGQREWFNQSPFYNHQTPYLHRWQFFQGAWWVLRTELVRALNWPIPELRHFGGDSLLGEVLRHRGARLLAFDKQVCINADERGQRSKAKRRGITSQEERPIGHLFKPGQQLTTSHHEFEVVVSQANPIQ